jgi:hypothetical protein
MPFQGAPLNQRPDPELIESTLAATLIGYRHRDELGTTISLVIEIVPT